MSCRVLARNLRAAYNRQVWNILSTHCYWNVKWEAWLAATVHLGSDPNSKWKTDSDNGDWPKDDRHNPFETFTIKISIQQIPISTFGYVSLTTTWWVMVDNGLPTSNKLIIFIFFQLRNLTICSRSLRRLVQLIVCKVLKKTLWSHCPLFLQGDEKMASMGEGKEIDNQCWGLPSPTGIIGREKQTE